MNAGIIPELLEDRSAWIDLVLSKTALIIASVVLLAAVYHMALNITDTNAREGLEHISKDLKREIDDIGSRGTDNLYTSSTYTLPASSLNTYSGLTGRISGEYLRIEATYKGKNIHSTVPLTFTVLPCNETLLRDQLGLFFSGNTGTLADPVQTDIGSLKQALAPIRARELTLEPDREIRIEKIAIYLYNNSEVNKIECTLVHQ